jgi:hypothetical protein
MSKVDSTQAGKVGDVLFRYMRARHHFKERVEHPMPAHELAALIGRGKREFDEIYIEPETNPPILLDGKADDVFAAIVNKKYRAIAFCDPRIVAAWRHYVSATALCRESRVLAGRPPSPRRSSRLPRPWPPIAR